MRYANLLTEKAKEREKLKQLDESSCADKGKYKN